MYIGLILLVLGVVIMIYSLASASIFWMITSFLVITAGAFMLVRGSSAGAISGLRNFSTQNGFSFRKLTSGEGGDINNFMAEHFPWFAKPADISIPKYIVDSRWRGCDIHTILIKQFIDYGLKVGRMGESTIMLADNQKMHFPKFSLRQFTFLSKFVHADPDWYASGGPDKEIFEYSLLLEPEDYEGIDEKTAALMIAAEEQANQNVGEASRSDVIDRLNHLLSSSMDEDLYKLIMNRPAIHISNYGFTGSDYEKLKFRQDASVEFAEKLCKSGFIGLDLCGPYILFFISTYALENEELSTAYQSVQSIIPALERMYA